MMKLLNGDQSIGLDKLVVTPVPSGDTVVITDQVALKYFADALRSANKEGHIPSHRPRKHHHAKVWLGTFHTAVIGLYVDPPNRGITIYYPYHEDGPSGIEYYYIQLTGRIPDQILDLYNTLATIDGREPIGNAGNK